MAEGTDSEGYLKMLSHYKCFDLAFSFFYSDSMNRSGGTDGETFKKNCEDHTSSAADFDRDFYSLRTVRAVHQSSYHCETDKTVGCDLRRVSA